MTNILQMANVNHHLSAFHPVTENDVRKVIETLATKSCELDEIPTTILKSCLEECLGIVTMVVNASLDQGPFVSTWKTTIVRPLLKKPGLELAESNYRPVSNLNFLSKVLKKKVALQHVVQWTLQNISSSPDHQSAIASTTHSRRHSSRLLMTSLILAYGRPRSNCNGCIDLSAAFDTVDHGTLEKVLRVKFGFTGKALSWFSSYLRPRYFMVNVWWSIFVFLKSVTFSVPQGSCAGPMLYSAYASTVTEVLPGNLEIHGYADDHAIKGIIYQRRTDGKIGLRDVRIITAGHQKMDERESAKEEWQQNWIHYLRNSATEVKNYNKLYWREQHTNIKVSMCEISWCFSRWELDNETSYHREVQDNKHINLIRIKNIRKYLTQEACSTLMLGWLLSTWLWKPHCSPGCLKSTFRDYNEYRTWQQNSF